jgi:hypothetical protein
VRPVFHVVLERTRWGREPAISTPAAARAWPPSWRPREIFDVDSPWIYADETTALRGLMSTGNAVRAMEQLDEKIVTNAYVKALAPFRQPDGSYRASAWFRCLLARR